MFSFRLLRAEGTSFRRTSYRAPVLAVLIIVFAAFPSSGQSDPQPPTFRAGQSMYIVAFRLYRHYPAVIDEAGANRQQDYTDYDLDAERKVRKRIEMWTFFKVAEKLSQADFVFLVSLDESSIEGLIIPLNAYQQHFREKFDLDALREAALGRYLIGPLKLPTLSRLSDRLVEQLRDRSQQNKPLRAK